MGMGVEGIEQMLSGFGLAVDGLGGMTYEDLLDR
jgi:hypothetical protein